MLAVADEDGYLPLHVVAGAGDDVDICNLLISAYPKATQVRDKQGMRPLDILEAGGGIEGQKERKNVGKIRDSIDKATSSYRRCYTCYTCGKDEDCSLKKCSACKYVSYCSVECQRKDWKKHKSVCKAKKALLAVPPKT